MSDCHPCLFCRGPAMPQADGTGTHWIECTVCRARGPAFRGEKAEAQAAAAFASPHRFGAIAAGQVAPGVTGPMVSLSNRMHLIAESVLAGEHGGVDSAVVLLRAGRHVSATLHKITGSDAERVMRAVLESSAIRRSTANHRTEPKK